MRNSERSALKYLQSRHQNEVVNFEPLGKSRFPDFSVGRLAVEVTEIHPSENQGEIGHWHTLSGVMASAISEVNKKIREYPPKIQDGSYYVNVDLITNNLRPKQFRKKLEERLLRFYDNVPTSFVEPEDFSIMLLKTSNAVTGDFFLRGIPSMTNVGAFVIGEYAVALLAAVERKSKRVELFKGESDSSCFDAFCLILVDELYPGCDCAPEIKSALASISAGIFQEIIVIERNEGIVLADKQLYS